MGDRERLLSLINDIIDRRWLTNGAAWRARSSKRRIVAFADFEHCVAMLAMPPGGWKIAILEFGVPVSSRNKRKLTIIRRLRKSVEVEV